MIVFQIQAWLLSDSVPRNDFVSANREGIYSLLGYLALYYLSSVLGSFISSTGIRLKSWIYRDLQLLLWTLVLFALQKLCESLFGPPSRRIVNAPYIIEMLVFHTFMTAGFLFVQLVSFFGWAAQMPQFKRDENAFELLQPCLLRAINKNAMCFFIIANVLTGVVNMLGIPSKYSGQYQSTACITLYILIVCASIFALSKRRRS
ncbi:unnamed protein product [Anisakis simplex]|uniref:Phosphatidylinositol-glycan biosynthesis class W protein (inferred by orthology to a human protein) n=1 Tax=Anisakis simplex TaxID=6269 RepID=A0A0M3J9T0_ANISI|nr:unnamed protein product [Anisakis simplex]